jgi:hypothetical protein
MPPKRSIFAHAIVVHLRRKRGSKFPQALFLARNQLHIDRIRFRGRKGYNRLAFPLRIWLCGPCKLTKNIGPERCRHALLPASNRPEIQLTNDNLMVTVNSSTAPIAQLARAHA